MSREEEINQAADEMVRQSLFSPYYLAWIPHNKIEYTVLFKSGVQWADQHPRKGLWDAQKVIEWLNAVDFSKYVENLSVIYVGRLKDDLIKAMED